MKLPKVTFERFDADLIKGAHISLLVGGALRLLVTITWAAK